MVKTSSPSRHNLVLGERSTPQLKLYKTHKSHIFNRFTLRKKWGKSLSIFLFILKWPSENWDALGSRVFQSPFITKLAKLLTFHPIQWMSNRTKRICSNWKIEQLLFSHANSPYNHTEICHLWTSCTTSHTTTHTFGFPENRSTENGPIRPFVFHNFAMISTMLSVSCNESFQW